MQQIKQPHLNLSSSGLPALQDCRESHVAQPVSVVYRRTVTLVQERCVATSSAWGTSMSLRRRLIKTSPCDDMRLLCHWMSHREQLPNRTDANETMSRQNSIIARHCSLCGSLVALAMHVSALSGSGNQRFFQPGIQDENQHYLLRAVKLHPSSRRSGGCNSKSNGS